MQLIDPDSQEHVLTERYAKWDSAPISVDVPFEAPSVEQWPESEPAERPLDETTVGILAVVGTSVAFVGLALLVALVRLVAP